MLFEYLWAISQSLLQSNKYGEKMIKFNNSKQIIINKQHRLGSHEKQPLLFSLAHLILC
jgi:hypothetical protein